MLVLEAYEILLLPLADHLSVICSLIWKAWQVFRSDTW